MKRKLLTLVTCFITVFVSAQTFIQNPIFEDYIETQIIGASDGIVGNGFVNTAAINNPAVTTLDLNNLEIDNFTGIEAFGFLELFSMVSNNAENIDQIDFSQNKNLTSISISSSDNLVDINVNGADALESLQIFRGNNLSNLDVSNNLNLNFLGVYTNNITTLNLSSNTLLKDLVIRDLPLLSNLTFTKELEGLILDNTALLSLDLTDMTSLGNSSFLSPNFQIENNTNLQFLELSNSQVQSVNLSSNPDLRSIILEFNAPLNSVILPAVDSPLQNLEVYGGNILNFDIENRTELESLTIFDIKATSLTVENLPKLNSFRLEENFLLTNLRLANTALTSFNGLQLNNGELVNVEIEENSNLQSLPLAIQDLRNLDRLSVVQNDLFSLNLSNLTTIETLSVRSNPNLTILDLASLQDGATLSNLQTFEGENTGIEILNFSSIPNIQVIRLAYNSALGGVPLKTLNLKNGNNAAITELNTSGNYPSLSCIQVDAVSVGTSPTGWVKDTQTVYVENCAATPVFVSFVLADQENLEDDAVPTPQLVLNGTVSVASTITVFDATSGSASPNLALDGTDYEFNNGSPLVIQIPADTYDVNNPIAVTGLTIFNDNDYEGRELMVLEVTSNSSELVNAADSAPLSSGTLLYNYNILEDDYRIDISAGPSVAENGSNSSFTISIIDDAGNTVNNDSGRDIEVLFSNIGDAMEIVDFTFIGSTGNSSVIINNTQNSSILTVNPSDDNLFEDDEFIDLEITNGEGYYLDPNNGVPIAGFSILDNDNRISFSSTGIGLEGGNDVTFTIALSDENGVAAINDTPNNLGFDIDFLPGTGTDAALLGTDFVDGIKNDVDKTVFIQNSQDSVTFEIEVINDTDSENQENFITTISDINQGVGIVVDNNQAVGLINDNDSNTNTVLVSFVAPNQADLEDNANPTPQLILNGTVTTATTIKLVDATGSSTVVNLAENSDYSFNNDSSLEIQIAAGVYNSNNPIAVVGLVIFSDDEFEGNELLIVEATSNSTELTNATDGSLLSNRALEYSYIIIEDDYRIDILAGADVTENGSNGSFTVSLLDENGNTVANQTGRDIQISYLDNGEAQQGTDYNLSGNTTIVNGENSASITVNTIDDNLFEGQEFVELEIQEGDGYYIDNNLPFPSSALAINDNDNNIVFLVTAVGVEGRQDVEFTTSLQDEIGNLATNSTQNGLSFDVALANGTGANPAEVGNDFVNGLKGVTGNSFFIELGQSSSSFQIEVIDDPQIEAQENFIATISTIESDIVLTNIQAVGLIDDNDGNTTATVQFQVPSFSDFEINNGDRPQLFINGTVSNPSTLTITDLNNGTATPSTQTANEDYILNNGTLTYTITIQPGVYDASNPIEITDFEIVDDSVYEGNETLNLQLTTATGDLSLGTNIDFQYTIIEDDFTVGFEISGPITEGEIGVLIVSLFNDNGDAVLNNTGQDIIVPFVATGTAELNDYDFNVGGSPVRISSGFGGLQLNLFAEDDTIVEGNETIIFTAEVGQYYKVDPILSTITATIIDNDGNGGNDTDNDGVLDNVDNCPTNANPDQADLDNDDLGDVCDPDIDGDGVVNGEDFFPMDETESSDNDNDGIGDNADPDDDNDNVIDEDDAFPFDETESSDNDSDGIGDNADTDDDNDGVLDTDDTCPLEVGLPEDDGCPATAMGIDEEDIRILVLSETCPDQNNGSFEVTITNQEYIFNVSLDGTLIGTANFDTPLAQNDLADGSYQVCMTVQELPGFEQCFGIVISTYERLAVDAHSIDVTNLSARFNVQGSKNYEVMVNDNRYRFQFENTSNKILEIQMEKGQNLVSITGESDCQGIFTDTIVIGNVTIFPNPVKDILNFSGFESTGEAQINIYTISGSLIKTIPENIENGDFNIQLSDLPEGIYLFRVVSEIEIIEFKIIKE